MPVLVIEGLSLIMVAGIIEREAEVYSFGRLLGVGTFGVGIRHVGADADASVYVACELRLDKVGMDLAAG